MTLAGRPDKTPAPIAPAPDPTAGRRVRAFVTPEGIDLRLRLADAGERAGAFILDVVILILTVLLFAFIAASGVLFSKGQAQEFVAVIWFLGFFALRNAYFIVFEIGPRAATPGKLLFGLRVAARDGGRLTAEAVFARNAMREIEFFLPVFLLLGAQAAADQVSGWLILLAFGWVGIFVLFPLFNRDRLRVGDFVAGTWVVKAPRQRLTIDLADSLEAGRARFDFTPEQAAAYGIKELHVLEDVLRRRDVRTMAAVATRIRRKIAWLNVPDETDLSFLSAYYAVLRGRLENRLLFGHRRKDKFDSA
ncbi:MAG: RDD family protein [Caulobacterales bacterium]